MDCPRQGARLVEVPPHGQRLRAVAMGVVLLLSRTAAIAQETAAQGTIAPGTIAPGTKVQGTVAQDRGELRSSPALGERAPSPEPLPLFVSGQRVHGVVDQHVSIEGDARLSQGDLVVHADKLEYRADNDQAQAVGSVRVWKAGDRFAGPRWSMQLGTRTGFFEKPSYHLLRNDAHGHAQRIDFLGADHIRIQGAQYTTCPCPTSTAAGMGKGGEPDWELRADWIDLDRQQNEGTARNAVLRFLGVPLLPVPYLSFPLGNQRKSGVLPPTVGIDNVDGYSLSVPYYWNIAPNRDATLTPTVMTKRGVMLGSEFRYLEPSHDGTVRLDWMPSDSLRDQSRWGLDTVHTARWNNPWTAWGDSPLHLRLQLRRVSDDDYWRDFPRADTLLFQRLLASEATLSWTQGDVSHRVQALRWQTLQDASAPIVPPYDRLPQLQSRYHREMGNGLNVSLLAEHTRFQSDETLTGQSNAWRSLGIATLGYPLSVSALSLLPTMQWHATRYRFDTPQADGQRTATRIVPTFSLDGTVVFERDASLFGRELLQTLEPRAFYVFTPFRDQHALPVYDTGARDFNLSSIYSTNAFVGNDRISDSNLLTLGLTTRWLDPATGAEAASFGVAQRLRLRDQNVTLPGESPVVDRISDVLWGGSIHWNEHWGFEGTMQFNPKTDSSIRTTLHGSYSPRTYHTLSAAYRFQRESSEQVDLGWQWPLQWGAESAQQAEARWYSVGRLNYSMHEGKLVDSILGFEHVARCWLARVVLERVQTGASSVSHRLMFQLEFFGFGRLGINPLKSLQEHIPGYTGLRSSASDSSPVSSFPSSSSSAPQLYSHYE
ncbi:LPS-assembly protein LptD [Candidatus Symbiobacter mobilis]|uniref:LPS-assembly protein LptD n=1 Tax=Candidatus Symbiobacter mobilis CR TaxID=946483 RepID=U5N633_9BURK|nr:LPS assembly protein LptD [Candidatus Symbiobacter mobilis]AGX86745.1 lipopolysaccharide assembly protein [Candidatus Symbiobacter mobilis CR]